MKQCIVIVFLACLVLCNNLAACRKRSSTSGQRQPDIEKPLVEALSPKGLRVSIPHVDGMEFFGFHGKINSPIGRSENGNLAEDVSFPTNGRWVFEDRNVQLHVGDVINYWIFVQINGMGYRLDNLSTIIREIVPTRKSEDRSGLTVTARPYSLASSPKNQNRLSNCKQAECHLIHTKSVEQSAECSCSIEQYSSVNKKLNTTLMQLRLLHDQIRPFQTQVESLTECIQELLKGMNVGTQLLLIGQGPPGTNALEAIRQLITEKLELIDLEHNIRQTYETDQGILFEMSSSVDKMRILYRANKRLKNSNYKIRDPQNPSSYQSNSNVGNEPKSFSTQNQFQNSMTTNYNLHHSDSRMLEQNERQEPLYEADRIRLSNAGSQQENYGNSYRSQEVQTNNRQTPKQQDSYETRNTQFGNSRIEKSSQRESVSRSQTSQLPRATISSSVRPEIQSNPQRSTGQRNNYKIQRGQPETKKRSQSNRQQQSYEIPGIPSRSSELILPASNQDIFNSRNLYV